MSHLPLISVIVPFYRVEDFLAEAIDSVLHQRYQHWELLLLDDGSTDGSTEIALSYASRYPEKIRYFHHPGRVNKGVVATRNLGVRHARGEWLALLDADDYWLPDKLAHQVSIARQHPEVSMICGASLYWYSWFDPQKQDVEVPVGAPADIVIPPPQAAVTLYPLGKGTSPCPCSVMIRKEVLVRLGAFQEQFKGKFSLYEDQAFLIKIYLHEAIFVSSKAMDRYRQRQGSIMSEAAAAGSYHEIRRFFLNWLTAYLDEKDIRYPGVRQKLREAIRVYHPTAGQKLVRRIKNYLLRIKDR